MAPFTQKATRVSLCCARQRLPGPRLAMQPGSMIVLSWLPSCLTAWLSVPYRPCLAGLDDRARHHAGVVSRGLGAASRPRRHRVLASTRSRAALTWHRGRFADECLSSSHVARLAVRRSGVISSDLTETSRVPPQAGPEYCGYSHVLKPVLQARELRGPRYMLMIDSPPNAFSLAVPPWQSFPPKLEWPMWCGMAGLGLGAGLTWLAVNWSHAALGLLSLVVVFGSLFLLGLALMRRLSTRFRRN